MSGGNVSVNEQVTETTERSELYREVPEEIPRFVVRRLDRDTLVRLVCDEPLSWTKRD